MTAGRVHAIYSMQDPASARDRSAIWIHRLDMTDKIDAINKQGEQVKKMLTWLLLLPESIQAPVQLCS